MSINWGKIAGAVVGGVCNFFAPGTGEIAAKLTDKGVDIAADIVGKIKAQKEGGKTDQEVAMSLTQQERAALMAGVNEAAKIASAQDAAFAAWIKSMSAEDKKLSTWRKSAKMAGKDPNLASTFGDDGTNLSYGNEKIAKSNLVIFKGFPNYVDGNQILSDAANMATTEPGENYVPQEDVSGGGGTDKSESGAVPGQQTTKKTTGTGFLWLMLLLLAGGLYWFFMVMPGEAARKRAAKARRAKKAKAEEKQITKPGIRKKKPVAKKTPAK